MSRLEKFCRSPHIRMCGCADRPLFALQRPRTDRRHLKRRKTFRSTVLLWSDSSLTCFNRELLTGSRKYRSQRRRLIRPSNCAQPQPSKHISKTDSLAKVRLMLKPPSLIDHAQAKAGKTTLSDGKRCPKLRMERPSRSSRRPDKARRSSCRPIGRSSSNSSRQRPPKSYYNPSSARASLPSFSPLLRGSLKARQIPEFDYSPNDPKPARYRLCRFRRRGLGHGCAGRSGQIRDGRHARDEGLSFDAIVRSF